MSAPAANFADRCQRATQAALGAGYAERLYPGAHRQGRELVAGDIFGRPGQSFRLNLDSGRWADFAAGQKGGDLVALVAEREGKSQGEALVRLEEELGLRPPEAAPRKTPPTTPAAKPTKELPPAPTDGPPSRRWVYTDQGGKPLYEAHRWEKEGHRKSCKTRGLKAGAERVPLHLPEVLAAIQAGKAIYVVEGEPKVDLLRSWGLTATTFAGGANGYNPGLAKWFAGADVVILPDADEPGRKFGRALAGDLAGLGLAPKTIELPGASFAGYDVIDWRQAGGTAEALAALVAAAPEAAPAGSERRIVPAAGSEHAWARALARGRQAYDWLLEGSLRRGQLGLICGPPGCGKGMLALHLATALAAGVPVLRRWGASRPARVLYLSAEDDQVILDNRLVSLYEAMPDEQRTEEMLERLWALPVQGRVNICQGDKSTGIQATSVLAEIRDLIARRKADLLILDTLARFFGVDENDNPAMTAACGFLEEIIAETGCNIILIHHANKAGGDLATKKEQLHAALTQTAIRGASALSGCVRWALLMAPLSDELALQVIGPETLGKPSGTYVAARVGKKNAGKTEQTLYLERVEHGLLQPVAPGEEMNQRNLIMHDAHMLAAEVDRREMRDEKRLSVTKGGREAFGWGDPRTKKAVEAALAEGLLIKIRNTGKQGYCLATPETEIETADMPEERLSE